MDVPSEAETALGDLIKAINYAIDGFLAFMMEDESESYFTQYYNYMDKWTGGLAAIKSK